MEQVLDQLHVHAPHLLHAPARVLIDDDQAISAIYLLDRSQEVPALYLYSNHSAGGRIDKSCMNRSSHLRMMIAISYHLQGDSRCLKKSLKR